MELKEGENEHEPAQEAQTGPAEESADSQQSASSPEASFHEALRAATPRVLVTQGLVVINVLVFVAMVVKGVHPMSPTSDDLVAWGANFGPATTAGEWWRLLACTFLHIGLLHIAFNMWVLMDLGPLVERLVGNAGFLALYFVSGLLGSLTSLWWNPLVVSAGASGAIFGILGALLGLIVRSPGGIPAAQIAALRNSSLAFLAYNLAYGFLRGNVDMAAHLGGLAAGFLSGLALGHGRLLEQASSRGRRNAVVAGGGGVLLLAGILALPKESGELARALEHLEAVEKRCLDALNAAGARVESGEMTDLDFARLLEEILPVWEAAMKELDEIEAIPVAMAEHVERIRRYARARQEGWSLLVTAIRQHDEQLAAEAQEKQREADRLVSEIRGESAAED